MNKKLVVDSGAVTSIPLRRFDVSDLSPKQRIDAWRDACNGFYDFVVDKTNAPPETVFFTWHRLDDLMFSSGQSFPHRAKRGSAHINQQRDYVRLLFPRRSSSRLVVGDQVFELTHGGIHVIDYSRPFVHHRDHGINLDGVYLPHDALGYDPARHPPCIGLSVQSAAGRVLANAFYTLKGELPRVAVTEAPALADGFKELVRTLMLRNSVPGNDSSGIRAARRQAMAAYVEQNLRDRSLGVERLAHVFAVSPPTVFRDFESRGGVARYIMDRRLERAFIDLVDHPPVRGAVRKVSESWGFDSPSHFSRRFRDRFGVSPSEVVDFAVNPGTDTPTAAALPARKDAAGHFLNYWFSPANAPAMTFAGHP